MVGTWGSMSKTERRACSRKARSPSLLAINQADLKCCNTVYTTTTPKTNNVFATAFSSAADATARAAVNAQLGNLTGSMGHKHAPGAPEQGNVGQAIRPLDNGSMSPTPPPLNTTPPSQKTINAPVNSSPSPAATASPSNQRSMGKALANNRNQGEDSPVMNETLSVIDEHITDMNSPGSILRAGERRGANDSGSEYSSHIDQRLSYIAGNETDEEERHMYNWRQVLAWSPSQVAENLRAMGVESRHCDFFKQQEITGEVLLQMDQETLFMPALDLGVVGRRLRTWHKIKALQDEIRGQEAVVEKASTAFASDNFSNDLELVPSRTSMSASPLPVPNAMDHSASRSTHSRQPSHNGQVINSPQTVYGHHRGESRVSQRSFSGKNAPDSPGRPSAASIRDLNQSRRQSAVELVTPPTPEYPTGANGFMSPQRCATSPHKKTPSLDRNWTMGIPARTGSARPASAISMSTDYNTFDPSAKDSSNGTWADRGYVSGSEAENKRSRNVLKKRCR